MLSIIIPTFNSERTLSDCIGSILKQTFLNYEIVVIDGGSTDNTLVILKEYEAIVPNLKWISEPDSGIYEAMNKGIKLANGDWLLFLGSDDLLFIENGLDLIFGNDNYTSKYHLIYCDVIQDETGLVIGEEKNRATILGGFINHTASFYHRSVFEKAGVYDTSYQVMADVVFNTKCFFEPAILTKYLPVVVSKFRFGGKSSDPAKYKHEVLAADIVSTYKKRLGFYERLWVEVNVEFRDNWYKKIMVHFKIVLLSIMFCFRSLVKREFKRVI